MENYQKVYEKHWKDIVENQDGSLNKDQIMRELADYNVMLNNVPKVYMEVANLSKPLTKPEAVISNLHENWVRRDVLKDDLKRATEDGGIYWEDIDRLV